MKDCKSHVPVQTFFFCTDLAADTHKRLQAPVATIQGFTTPTCRGLLLCRATHQHAGSSEDFSPDFWKPSLPLIEHRASQFAKVTSYAAFLTITTLLLNIFPFASLANPMLSSLEDLPELQALRFCPSHALLFLNPLADPQIKALCPPVLHPEYPLLLQDTVNFFFLIF